MRTLRPELERRGASFVIVGNGTPVQAAAFEAEHGAAPVFTDPSRAIFDAAGFTRSPRASLSPRAVGRAIAALRAGFRPGRMQGSALQQGGVLVVDGAGELRARYVSRFGGEHPGDAWILDALD